LDMFPLVERKYFKIVDVEMQVVIEWWGYSNHLKYYKVYGTMMNMFITKFMNNQPQKQCINMEDVHMEID
jgi:hypothetical protein